MSHRLHHVPAQQVAHGVREQSLPVREETQRAGPRPAAQRVASQDLVPKQKGQGQKSLWKQESFGCLAEGASFDSVGFPLSGTQMEVGTKVHQECIPSTCILDGDLHEHTNKK
ncbi:hypothetical protein HNY73_007710 [Argiope bruennichi]|uniref:Uncharacterized protein n=1 Tax=Argiope bruennichi TaxID=94029 RepID=A0A8T0FKA0_ARGBR|nr:hypothetical protein HNY73_007710 [Argiope bruennichi]